MAKLRGAVVFAVCSLATACLITNCPKGGKRSKSSVESAVVPEGMCTRCGPGLQGRCLGPAVCCGPRLGCLLATPGIVSQCEGAGSPTIHRGKPCITFSGLGVCATDGVCCNSESCRIDLSCEMEPFADICSPNDLLQESRF